MDMEDGLPGVAVAVEHRAIPPVRVATVSRQLGGDPQHRPDEGIIGCSQVVQRGDVASGHDQHVQRRLWIQIGECDHVRIFVHARGWNLTVDDLAEHAIDHAPILSDWRDGSTASSAVAQAAEERFRGVLGTRDAVTSRARQNRRLPQEKQR